MVKMYLSILEEQLHHAMQRRDDLVHLQEQALTETATCFQHSAMVGGILIPIGECECPVDIGIRQRQENAALVDIESINKVAKYLQMWLEYLKHKYNPTNV